METLAKTRNLLFSPHCCGRMRELYRATGIGRRFGDVVIENASALLSLPPCRRIQEGRRILAVSREVVYRATTLSVAFVLTDNEAFARRAIAELVAVSEFSDWNPSHFLDTAEMAFAVACAYDVFRDRMTEEQCELVENALRAKALAESWKDDYFFTGRNNWTQVCNSGMVAAALALGDPAEMERTVRRAVDNLPRVMYVSYGGNGCYPEGPRYWAYGTEYNVLLLMMLKNVRGTDYGLSSLPGFDHCGDFIKASSGDSGETFSFSDNSGGFPLSFATFFLAEKFGRFDYFEGGFAVALNSFLDRRSSEYLHNRLLPLAMPFLAHVGTLSTRETPGVYFGGDPEGTQTAIFRTSADRSGIYLGVKGGSPQASHSHLDNGSFVLEFGGVRFVEDLGSEDYERIEKQHWTLWDSAQSSDRWNVFRIGSAGHGVLTLDGAALRVDGSARFVGQSNSHVEMDLSSLYSAPVRVGRRVSVPGGAAVVVADSIAGTERGVRAQFQFLTFAEPVRCEAETLVLRRGGIDMSVKIRRKNAISVLPCWKITRADDMIRPFETPNPGCRIVSFAVDVPAGEVCEYEVVFQREKQV